MCTGNKSCQRDRCRLHRWSKLRLHSHQCWRCNRARSSHSRIYTNNCRANLCMWPRCGTRTAVPNTRPHPVRIAYPWRPVDTSKSTHSLGPCRWHHFDRDCPYNHQYFPRSDRLGILKNERIAIRYLLTKIRDCILILNLGDLEIL